ncbi:MAG TPA: hypothetical protein ENI22_01715 [Candidatus Pacearchaeota archaeon]|nr:hypothetical protein [Candidatus Pacearchaeota archaeon]
MRKSIYLKSGNGRTKVEHGLFDQCEFDEYITKYRGAEWVSSCIANGGKYQVRVYHIEPQGVTVLHTKNKKGTVLIHLLGSREGIGEVEKMIIIDAAESFKKPSAKVPA